MEIERLKGLKAEDDRNQIKQAAIRRGAAVIVEQIQDRNLVRMKE